MKKIVLFMVSILAFASCSKNNFDTITPQEVKEQQYAAAFEQTFGAPAPTQTWGFTTPAKTRAVDVNGNLWYQKWKRPTNVTQEEIDWAKEEFGKVREDVQPWVSIEWSNYWVQQVYQGQRGSIDGNGNTVYPSGVMNRLMVFNNKKTNVISWYPYEEEVVTYEGEYEHVNNFNSANNTTEYTDDVTKEKFNGTTLMINMGTDGRAEQFAYHNTSSSDYYYSYIVLEHNGSYFVGFDIVGYHPIGQDGNANMDVTRDWIFDDWIVKITPAKSVTEPDEDAVKETGRIICEDLGGIGDFDFNDVVFDATIYESGRTVITILAAGGTLPISVAGEDISSVMGHMVNTIKGGATHEPYTFTAANTYNSLVDIPIVVTNKDNANQLYQYELKANMGEAPQKIKVPTTFRWCQEYKEHSIDKAYPGFTEWVTGGTFWDGEVNEEHLY